MHVYRAHRDVTVLNDYIAVPGLGFLPVNAVRDPLPPGRLSSTPASSCR